MHTEAVHFKDKVADIEAFNVLWQLGILDVDRLGDIFWLLSANVLPVIMMHLRCWPAVILIVVVLRLLPRVLGFLFKPLFHQTVAGGGGAVFESIT